MKTLMVAALGLSLLSGTAVFAQNTSGSTMTKKTKHKHKGNKSTDSTSTTSTTK